MRKLHRKRSSDPPSHGYTYDVERAGCPGWTEVEEEEGELGGVEGGCVRGVRGGGVSAAVEVWLVGWGGGGGVVSVCWKGRREGRTVYEDLIPFLCEVGRDVCPYNRRHR